MEEEEEEAGVGDEKEDRIRVWVLGKWREFVWRLALDLEEVRVLGMRESLEEAVAIFGEVAAVGGDPNLVALYGKRLMNSPWTHCWTGLVGM